MKNSKSSKQVNPLTLQVEILTKKVKAQDKIIRKIVKELTLTQNRLALLKDYVLTDEAVAELDHIRQYGCERVH